MWWSQRGPKWLYGAFSLHAGQVRLHAHIHTSIPSPTHTRARAYTEICNTEPIAFFTATMFPRTLLNFTLYMHCLSCFLRIGKGCDEVRRILLRSTHTVFLTLWMNSCIKNEDSVCRTAGRLYCLVSLRDIWMRIKIHFPSRSVSFKTDCVYCFSVCMSITLQCDVKCTHCSCSFNTVLTDRKRNSHCC